MRLIDAEALKYNINVKRRGKVLFEVGYNMAIDKAVEAIDNAPAIDEKRIVVLPCALGETLWRVCEFRVTTGKPAFYVRAVEFNENNFYRIVFGGEYGKIVFNTKEEAVEAMEKMKNA